MPKNGLSGYVSMQKKGSLQCNLIVMADRFNYPLSTLSTTTSSNDNNTTSTQ